MGTYAAGAVSAFCQGIVSISGSFHTAPPELELRMP